MHNNIPFLLCRHFTHLASTQQYAMENANNLLKNHAWAVVTAESQTQGQGRHGRVWISPFGNFYATYVTHWPISQSHLCLHITQVIALAVTHYLQHLNVAARIKWMNDIYVHDAKISGILVDVIYDGKSITLYMGVGVNVYHHPKHYDGLGQKTTCLAEHLAQMPSIKNISRSLHHFIITYVMRLQTHGFHVFFREISLQMLGVGRCVRVTHHTPCKHEKCITGVFQGITPQGFMRLKTDGGRICIMQAGSVRFQ